MKEVIFEVREDEIDGGYTASALGYGIHTEADSLDDLKKNVKEAVECFFDEGETPPAIIRLHFVRDEVLAVVARAEGDARPRLGGALWSEARAWISRQTCGTKSALVHFGGKRSNTAMMS